MDVFDRPLKSAGVVDAEQLADQGEPMERPPYIRIKVTDRVG